MNFELDKDLLALQARAQHQAASTRTSGEPDASEADRHVRDWLAPALWAQTGQSASSSAVVLVELARTSPWLALSLGHHLSALAALGCFGGTGPENPDAFSDGRKILCLGLTGRDDDTSTPSDTSEKATAVVNAQVADSLLLLAEGTKDRGVAATLRDMTEPRPLPKPHAYLLMADVSPAERAAASLPLDGETARVARVTYGNRLRLAVAATCVGIARSATQRAVEAGRAARHRMPQTAQFAVSDCATETDAAELLLLDAAARADSVPGTSAAKLFCSRAATGVVHRTMRVCGGADAALERLYLTAGFLESYESSSDHALDRIAADMLQE